MRGEYGEIRLRDIENLELPPRARRIRYISPARADWMGTTSACAENTRNRAPPASQHRNYLRVRGEYNRRRLSRKLLSELPPRARRIPLVSSRKTASRGTTSACAENTRRKSTPKRHNRNYLRVRGEYSPNPDPGWLSGELPPRARRIPGRVQWVSVKHGTTSACAENTINIIPLTHPARNYLRVRGEYQYKR